MRNAYNDLDRAAVVVGVDEYLVQCDDDVQNVLQVAVRALYFFQTDYLHGGVRYATNRGVVQGCSLGMLFFCIAYAGPLDWINAAVRAVEQDVPVEFRIQPPPADAAEIKAWVGRTKQEFAGLRVGAPPLIVSNDVFVRAYADNAIIRCCAQLLRFLPDLAKTCLDVAGLQFKPNWRGAAHVRHEHRQACSTERGAGCLGRPAEPRGVRYVSRSGRAHRRAHRDGCVHARDAHGEGRGVRQVRRTRMAR